MKETVQTRQSKVCTIQFQMYFISQWKKITFNYWILNFMNNPVQGYIGQLNPAGLFRLMFELPIAKQWVFITAEYSLIHVYLHVYQCITDIRKLFCSTLSGSWTLRERVQCTPYYSLNYHPTPHSFFYILMKDDI